VWPATAAPPGNFPHQIALPNGFFPEGIESGRGTSVFVGSLIDGAIWRGNLRTGSGAVFADGAQGRVSAGIAYEAARHRLWVAGSGPSILGTGDVRVYDASSGALLATFAIPAPPTPAVRFLNDVAVTRDAVYVTDSFNPQHVVIPLPANGSLPLVNSATLLLTAVCTAYATHHSCRSFTHQSSWPAFDHGAVSTSNGGGLPGDLLRQPTRLSDL
jgi:hypothetical protein